MSSPSERRTRTGLSTRLWQLFAALLGALFVLGACSQEVAESTTTTIPPTSAVSTTVATGDLGVSTTSRPPPIRMSLVQVFGGSVSADGVEPPEVAGDPPLEQSSMRAITVNGATLVAGGAFTPAGGSTTDAAVWTSPDGVVWSRVTDVAAVFGDEGASAEPRHQFINDIAAGPLGVVAVGADGIALDYDAAIWYSSDGVLWQRIQHDPDIFGGVGLQILNSVVQLPGLVVAVGESDGEAAAWTSRDGSVWDRAEVNDQYVADGEPASMNDVVVAGGGLVAVGRGGLEPRPAVWLSADGLTWERLLDSMAGEHSGFVAAESSMSAMMAVTASGEGLVATGVKLLRDEYLTRAERGTGGALVWTSNDGYEWQQVESNFLELAGEEESSRYAYLKRGAPITLEDVAWQAETLVAIGGYELIPSANALPSFITLWTSTDGGTTWRITAETTLEPTDSWRGAWAFTRFGDSLVIVGNDDVPAGKHPDYGWMTYAQTPAVWIAANPESG